MADLVIKLKMEELGFKTAYIFACSPPREGMTH